MLPPSTKELHQMNERLCSRLDALISIDTAIMSMMRVAMPKAITKEQREQDANIRELIGISQEALSKIKP